MAAVAVQTAFPQEEEEEEEECVEAASGGVAVVTSHPGRASVSRQMHTLPRYALAF